MSLTIAAMIGAVILAVIKGIFGTDKPIERTVVDVPGVPLGPQLIERLRRIQEGDSK